MGFSTLIDILGSTMVGGLLLLILLRLNDASVESTFTYSAELNVQESLVEVVTIIEHDFRKMGYCENWQNIADPSSAIIYADTGKISFLTDVAVSELLPGDGVVDTLHYYTGTTGELSSTENPNDKMLYRVINGATAKSSNIGITNFKLTYFDSFGSKINTPITGASTGSIHTLQIDIELQNTAAYDEQYLSVFWRQIRLAARNLRNR